VLGQGGVKNKRYYREGRDLDDDGLVGGEERAAAVVAACVLLREGSPPTHPLLLDAAPPVAGTRTRLYQSPAAARPERSSRFCKKRFSFSYNKSTDPSMVNQGVYIN
jgi:hypothetical protein